MSITSSPSERVAFCDPHFKKLRGKFNKAPERSLPRYGAEQTRYRWMLNFHGGVPVLIETNHFDGILCYSGRILAFPVAAAFVLLKASRSCRVR